MDYYSLLNDFKTENIFENVYKPEGKSCCLVGNSGIVLDSEKGYLIDKCDYIIRLNNSKTEGFEKHVGSRTDLRVINIHSFRALNDYNSGEMQKSSFPEFDSDFIIKQSNQTILNTEGIYVSPKNLEIIHKNNCEIIYFSSKILNKIRQCNPKPTTGYLGLLIAISCFDDVFVSGFDFYADQSREHYFEKTVPYDRSKVHSIDLEKEIFYKLINENKIKWI